VTARAAADLGEVTAVTHIATKQDMSRWTRAHADAPGITWSVLAGPGGTMLIIEHARDRAAVAAEPRTAVGAASQKAAA
jgi:hypothetical protein